MTKCVCGNPEFEDQNINKDSDSGQKNESIIQPSEPETASNHKPNKLTNSNENNDFSADIEDFYDVVQHANTSVLCDILKKQNFDKSEGPFLEDRPKPDRGPNKFGKIHKNLNCLLGNGRNQVLTIPEIVDELFPRNYDEMIHFDGTEKLVTFVPEWYLTKAPKYVDPSRGPQLQEYSERMANEQLCPERKKVFEEMKKFHLGGRRTHRGELPERELYDTLKTHFDGKNESVAVFHGLDILKMNLDRFKVNEKDFVILNATRRSIIVIEVKQTLGAGDSIEKSTQQLCEAKEDLEAWFGTEGLDHWTYIPMIYTEKVEPANDCNRCNQHIMRGNSKHKSIVCRGSPLFLHFLLL